MEETRQIQPTATENNNSDDLDLIGLIRICWRAFVKYIFKPIEFCFRFGLKRWWIMIIMAVAAFALSFSYNIWINPKFTMSFKLMSRTSISAQYYIDEINRLQENIDKNEVAAIINVPADSMRYIKNISGYYCVFADSLHSITIKDKDKKFANFEATGDFGEFGVSTKEFFVEVSVRKHPELVNGFDNAIINYLTSKPYVVATSANDIVNWQQMQQVYNTEIQKLDSLRDIEYFSDKTILASGVEITTNQTQILTESIINANTQHEYYARLLRNKEILTVLIPATVQLDYKIVSDGIPQTILMCLLGFAIMLCLHFRKEIAKYAKS